MTDISHPTQMLVCFCISILCVFVCACVCLCNFLGACLPVSLAVRARGMTGVGASPSYYRAFDFTTEAKWDSRYKETCKAAKERVHAMWLLANNNNHFHDTHSINCVFAAQFMCLCEVRDRAEDALPCTGHICNIDTYSIIPLFASHYSLTHSERIFIHSGWQFQLSRNKDRSFVIEISMLIIVGEQEVILIFCTKNKDKTMIS